jgi:hypothetical protein
LSGQQFDDLTKTLVTSGTSRRSFLKRAVGAAVAGFFGADATPALAHHERRHDLPRGGRQLSRERRLLHALLRPVHVDVPLPPDPISTGTAEANRELALVSPILLDQDFAVATSFGATGTPMGVLIDPHGNVASDLAAGAPAVLALARAPWGAADPRAPG